ncbi:MAG: cysteine peptidase family C39 domain-containing protein [Desulfobacterales bacterium]
MDTLLDFDINKQPDNTTCGPTCLHAVYRYYNDSISLQEVIAEVSLMEEGGTLAVYLACHALRRGYKTTIFPYNLQIFDPTWSAIPRKEIAARLRRQLSYKKDIPGFELVTKAYLEYLELGGQLKFKVMTASLIRQYLKKSIPILTGLSATYLYDEAREYDTGSDPVYDDVRGESTGHFVVLTGYNKEDRSVSVADPLKKNPIASSRYYSVNIYRLVCAIMLGILSYDGNLLIIQTKKRKVDLSGG